MDNKIRNLISLIVLFATIAITSIVSAESRVPDEVKASYSNQLTRHPILETPSPLRVVSPAAYKQLENRVGFVIQSVHKRLDLLWGPTETPEVTIKLMKENDFFRLTGAPKWTNAMYFRKTISIPVKNPESPASQDVLLRAVRHEYIHAVVNSISGGKAPGWLDEGLAQWGEGSENPALGRSLIRWLKNNKPIPLSAMKGGFTTLQTGMVAPAYAQSLYLTRTLINTFGFRQIRKYLALLKNGEDSYRAFSRSFGITTEYFETESSRKLTAWNRRL